MGTKATCFICASVLLMSVASSTALAQPAPAIDSYQLPGNGATVQTLTAGPDGVMWFTMSTCDDADPGCGTDVRHEHIGRITPAGVITTFPLPFDPTPLGAGAYGITTGPDQALWFTEIRGHRIGRMTTTGDLTFYPLPAPHSAPYLITTGSDGALWFTESYAIGRITTSGVVSRFPITVEYSSDPTAITSGPDGALWFTEVNLNRVGRISTAGIAATFDLPDSCAPLGIVPGPDGALWFGCLIGNSIGRITLDGMLSSYAVPTPNSGPSYLAPGPDGALWFTEQSANTIGRITTDGLIDEYVLVSGSGLPHDIAAGPGGVWFSNIHHIGRIRFADALPPTISGMPGADCGLWPPNHHLKAVARITAADVDSGVAPGSLVVTVTSNETQMPGAPDYMITADGAGGFIIELRAERRGAGDGRVYTIGARVLDRAGNVATASSTCTVPHDVGR